jgi:putative N-acetyltransferase (TIGR04045 family)
VNAVAIGIRDEPLVTGCRRATEPDLLARHFEVRRRVFVEEQRLFASTDCDEVDLRAETIHLVALFDGTVVGAVRLYPLDLPGTRWKGDRLAVLPQFRASTFGSDLVRLAVRTSSLVGGRVMVAMIQPANVRNFERLGWVRDGEPVEYVGHRHQPMRIPLWFNAIVGA